MNKLRNTLKKEYSQIPNELITDMTLPAGALRVILYLFTKPDDWSVYNKDICKQLEISEQTLTKYWKILLSSKWLRRELAAGKDGKLIATQDDFGRKPKSQEEWDKKERQALDMEKHIRKMLDKERDKRLEKQSKK